MKRFWLVLLSLGLTMSFSVSAFAVDVKFSGSMYAAGMYVNKTSLTDAGDGQNTAFYFQRLRLQTEFIAAPGVSVITRADVMERVWGATRTAATDTSASTSGSLATKAENENIGFDYAFIQYATPAGTFKVGAQPAGTWGTVFGDSAGPAFRLWYMSPSLGGGFQVIALMQKGLENSYTANNTTATQSDKDYEIYVAGLIYRTKPVTAGLAGYFYNNASTRDNTATSLKRKFYQVAPYALANIGPVKIQAELSYQFGKWAEYDTAAGNTDVKLDSLAYWLDLTANFGMVYVGGTFAYSRGENADTADVKENSLTGGLDWSPTLIMWNEDRAVWFGALTGNSVTGFGTGMSNAYLYQIRGGVKPTDKLDIMASVTYATADTTPAGYVSKNYGYEVDVTGTYKITSNLSYMLGIGYLITGDYFKGTDSNNKVVNDYLVINKLTLTF